MSQQDQNQPKSSGLLRSIRRPRISDPVRRFAGLLSPVRGAVWMVALLTAVSVVVAAIGPIVLARATDTMVDGVLGRTLPAGMSKEQAVQHLRDNGQGAYANVISAADVTPGAGIDFVALGQLLLLAVTLYLVVATLQLLAARILNRAIHQVVSDMRTRVERKIHRLPVPVADASPRGDLLSRTTNDVDNVTVAMTQALGQLLTSALTAVSVLAMMIYLSPILTVAAVIVLPLGVYATKRLMKASQSSFMGQMQHMGLLSVSVDESLNGHQITTAFGRKQERIDAFRAENDALAADSRRAQAVSGMASPVMGFVGHLSYVAICVLGGLRVASGTMTIGEVQAFIQYGRQFSGPVAEISGLLNELQAGIASSERMHELLGMPEEEVGAPTETPRYGSVELTDVEFGYQPGRPVLRGVSLRADPGETVALVGPSGAGKTTLVNLLMRFYEPSAGEIRVDGRDIASMDRADVRSRVGMVLQDAWLFEGTIRENIAYGAEGATEDDVVEAARLARVDHMVDTFADGLDTRVEADGGNLSAGERQLITIARAFVAKPQILILDEATSAVDSRTEMLVQQALATLRRGRTSLVIAHRLSTVRGADRIVVLDAGRVAEAGTHDELVATDGEYAQRFRAQQVTEPRAGAGAMA